MTFNDEHPLKIPSSISIVDGGICIDSNDSQNSNAASPIICKPFGNLIDFNERQSRNALISILITGGMMTSDKDEQ